MMKVSTRTRYGLRLMTELALRFDKGRQLLGDIASREGISQKYLSQIVIPLKAGGLVKSLRGSQGGYMLGRRPQEITIKEIIETLEGSIDLVGCVDEPSSCRRISSCASRGVWVKLKEKIADTLEGITLYDLVEMHKDKEKRVMMYNI